VILLLLPGHDLSPFPQIVIKFKPLSRGQRCSNCILPRVEHMEWPNCRRLLTSKYFRYITIRCVSAPSTPST
jgi:hypothetical protein